MCLSAIGPVSWWVQEVVVANLTDDDRTHLLFSLLDGLRLVIPRLSKDASATDQSRRTLIPGVYYVFYQMPASRAIKPLQLPTPAKPGQRRAVTLPRLRAGTKDTAATKVDDEPLEGLYDRRQVQKKQKIITDRRRAPPAAKSFPICEIGGVTYILNPNAEIIIGLPRSAK